MSKPEAFTPDEVDEAFATFEVIDLRADVDGTIHLDDLEPVTTRQINAQVNEDLPKEKQHTWGTTQAAVLAAMRYAATIYEDDVIVPVRATDAGGATWLLIRAASKPVLKGEDGSPNYMSIPPKRALMLLADEDRERLGIPPEGVPLTQATQAAPESSPTPVSEPMQSAEPVAAPVVSEPEPVQAPEPVAAAPVAVVDEEDEPAPATPPTPVAGPVAVVDEDEPAAPMVAPATPAPVAAPEPVASPAPVVSEPEPVQAPEPVVVAEPAPAQVEPAIQAEVVQTPVQPVAAAAPVSTPEPVVVAEPVAQPEPVQAPVVSQSPATTPEPPTPALSQPAQPVRPVQPVQADPVAPAFPPVPATTDGGVGQPVWKPMGQPEQAPVQVEGDPFWDVVSPSEFAAQPASVGSAPVAGSAPSGVNTAWPAPPVSPGGVASTGPSASGFAGAPNPGVDDEQVRTLAAALMAQQAQGQAPQAPATMPAQPQGGLGGLAQAAQGNPYGAFQATPETPKGKKGKKVKGPKPPKAPKAPGQGSSKVTRRVLLGGLGVVALGGVGVVGMRVMNLSKEDPAPAKAASKAASATMPPRPSGGKVALPVKMSPAMLAEKANWSELIKPQTAPLPLSSGVLILDPDGQLVALSEDGKKSSAVKVPGDAKAMYFDGGNVWVDSLSKLTRVKVDGLALGEPAGFDVPAGATLSWAGGYPLMTGSDGQASCVDGDGVYQVSVSSGFVATAGGDQGVLMMDGAGRFEIANRSGKTGEGRVAGPEGAALSLIRTLSATQVALGWDDGTLTVYDVTAKASQVQVGGAPVTSLMGADPIMIPDLQLWLLGPMVIDMSAQKAYRAQFEPLACDRSWLYGQNSGDKWVAVPVGKADSTPVEISQNAPAIPWGGSKNLSYVVDTDSGNWGVYALNH